jgi:hypothetical protein
MPNRFGSGSTQHANDTGNIEYADWVESMLRCVIRGIGHDADG